MPLPNARPKGDCLADDVLIIYSLKCRMHNDRQVLRLKQKGTTSIIRNTLVCRPDKNNNVSVEQNESHYDKP